MVVPPAPLIAMSFFDAVPYFALPGFQLCFALAALITEAGGSGDRPVRLVGADSTFGAPGALLGASAAVAEWPVLGAAAAVAPRSLAARPLAPRPMAPIAAQV